MTESSIISLIKKGEGLSIEFKRSIDSAYKIAKTIVSFANTSGGDLLIGIADDGKITGVQSELRELSKLEKATSELISPLITIQLRAEYLDGKRILQVRVEEGVDKPYIAVNEKQQRIIYIRTHNKSVPIPRLLMSGEKDENTQKMLENKNVKTLITYLRETDSINSKAFSRLVNISEQRAERLLNDLANHQILIKISKRRPEMFSLKWAE